MKRNLISILFLFSILYTSYAQDGFFNGHQLRFVGSNGFTRFKSTLIKGEPMKSPLLPQGSLSLEALFYNRKGFFVAPTVGLLYTTQKNNVSIYGRDWNYLEGLTPIVYLKPEIGIGYAKQISTKNTMRHQIKFGVLKRGDYSIRKGSGNSITKLQTNDKFHPFLSLQSSIGHITQSNNIIEFGIYYTHSLSDIYFGDYNNHITKATFTGKGSELGVSIGYVFTRYKTRQTKAQSLAALKAYRNQRRYIKPGARLLEFSVGVFAPINIINDPEEFYLNGINASAGFRLEMEFGTKVNHFWEAGLHTALYYSGYDIVPDGNNSIIGSFSGDFYALALSVGKGYRIPLRHNVNLLTLSGGLTLNANISPGGHSGKTYGYQDKGRLADMSYNTEINTIYFPSIYANINKDWRLTNRMFLSMNYRFNLGFIPTQTIRYQVEIIDTGEQRNFTGKLNGTSHAYELGLKYVLGDVSLSDDNLESINSSNRRRKPSRTQRGRAKRRSNQNKKLTTKKDSTTHKTIGPKSKLLSIGTGLMYAINESSDSESLLLGSSFGTAALRAGVEFGIGKHLFCTTGLHIAEYDEAYIINPKTTSGIDSGKKISDVAFHGLSLYGGIGHRFKLNKKYNLFTLSAGLTANYVLVDQEYVFNASQVPSILPWGKFEVDDKEYKLDTHLKTVSKLTPSFYVNANKDFRISDKMFLSLNYRFNYGWKTIYRKEINLVSEDPSENRAFDLTIDGTSHAYEVGVKWILGK